jgi:hypothetical protein
LGASHQLELDGGADQQSSQDACCGDLDGRLPHGPTGITPRFEKINPSYVSRILRLAYLSPKVVKAILDGSHPAWLTMRDLLEPFPMDWQLQEKKFLARFEESNLSSEY